MPPETEVWPGHLGGSLCGGPGMDMKTSSTVGYERRHNELLHEEDEDRFVERMLATLGPQPPNLEAVVELNRGPLLTAGVEVGPLAPRQVALKRSEGALIVDVRTDLQFDEAHIPGAVAITALRAGFGTKLAWLADREQEIVFVGRDDEDGREAAKLATAVGIRKLGGYLAGGMTAWRAESRDAARIERLPAGDLYFRRDEEPALQILDVRERDEWEAGHIPSSIHVPYHDLHELPAELDPARPVAVLCASGQRAAVAASMLARLGSERVVHVVDGGVGTWERAGHPIERAA
jgi:rhodanese-related sulfurtransferase